jgi:hypothetical protein
MKDFVNIERLPSDVGKKVASYMEQMLKIHNTDILSIFIYGSACSSDYIKGISDINSAIIFKQMDFSQLKKSLGLIREGLRKKITAPLYLTPEYIKNSCDTFPLEFLEMKENHILIYGEELLKDLDISHSNIRYVCEEQLKGKLIRMRQAYLEVGLHKKAVKALIKESLNSLIPVLRGLLRLKAISPPVSKEEVISLISKNFGVDEDIFLVMLKDRKKDQRTLEGLFASYLEQIKILSEAADRL